MVAPIGRRGFVARGAAGAAALSAGVWPLRSGHAAATIDFDEARHLLSRTTFGATPAEIRSLEAQDYVAIVDRLLAGVRRDAITPPPGWLNEGPAELRRQQQMARAERAEAQKKQGVDGKPLEAPQQPLQEQGRELRNWWVEEMLVTDQPLVERMTLFWHNHFTSSIAKVRYVPALYRQNALFGIELRLHLRQCPHRLLLLVGAQVAHAVDQRRQPGLVERHPPVFGDDLLAHLLHLARPLAPHLGVLFEDAAQRLALPGIEIEIAGNDLEGTRSRARRRRWRRWRQHALLERQRSADPTPVDEAADEEGVQQQ